MFTRGQRQRIRNATVDADGRRDIGGSHVLNGKREGDMPAVWAKADCCVVHLAPQWAGIAKPHPADLGQTNLRPVAVKPN